MAKRGPSTPPAMPLPGPPAPLLQKSIGCPAPSLSSAHQELAHGSWGRAGGWPSRSAGLMFCPLSTVPVTPPLRQCQSLTWLWLGDHSPPGPALCPWDSPGKPTGVGSHSLLRGILPTQGSNPGLLHYRQILYHLIQRPLPNSSSRPPCPGNPARENRREVVLKNTLSPPPPTSTFPSFRQGEKF